jgi:hypothetical protein
MDEQDNDKRRLEPPPGNLRFWLAWEPRCFPQKGERRGIFDKPFLEMTRAEVVWRLSIEPDKNCLDQDKLAILEWRLRFTDEEWERWRMLRRVGQ